MYEKVDKPSNVYHIKPPPHIIVRQHVAIRYFRKCYHLSFCKISLGLNLESLRGKYRTTQVLTILRAPFYDIIPFLTLILYQSLSLCMVNIKLHRSSRAHSLLLLDLEQTIVSRGGHGDEVTVRSQLCLADLGGSEQIKKSGATGETQREATEINLGLLALKQCSKHVPRSFFDPFFVLSNVSVCIDLI